ncbi:MAG: hypothetical protein V4490_00535 [Pseudomonadota bacterium]
MHHTVRHTTLRLFVGLGLFVGISMAQAAEFYIHGAAGRAQSRGVVPVSMYGSYSAYLDELTLESYDINYPSLKSSYRAGVGYHQPLFRAFVGRIEIGYSGLGVRQLIAADSSTAQYYLSGGDASLNLGYTMGAHMPNIAVGVVRVANQLAQTAIGVSTKVRYGTYYDTRMRYSIGYQYGVTKKVRLRWDVAYIPGHAVTANQTTQPNTGYDIKPNNFPELVSMLMGIEFGRS